MTQSVCVGVCVCFAAEQAEVEFRVQQKVREANERRAWWLRLYCCLRLSFWGTAGLTTVINSHQRSAGLLSVPVGLDPPDRLDLVLGSGTDLAKAGE